MHELQNVAAPDVVRAPRVLRVDVSRAPRPPALRTEGPQRCGGIDASLAPWEDDGTTAGRIAGWSGSALGLVLLDRAEARVDEAEARVGCSSSPLVISVADGVRRGLPTAARATIAARSPLTGRYSDGQIGSDLARWLVRCADALVLSGHTDVPGAVLRICTPKSNGPCPVVELWSWPELRDHTPASIGAELERRFGPCASVRIGWAGARGVRYASLAAGVEPQSFVGRGGLGAVFGALGLVALVIDGDPLDDACAPVELAQRVSEWLVRSPRLRARARGGTLELAEAFATRGDLRAHDYEQSWSADRAREWTRDVARASGARTGCAGCPTPCGWTFDTDGDGATRRGGRFSALYALGPNLGVQSGADALDLLAHCDDAGLDAKELGAALAVLCRAQELDRIAAHTHEPAWWGNVDALRARLDELRIGSGPGALLAHGAAALARELRVEATTAHGDALRPEASLAVLLGQCVSSRGSDPMRTNPFLLDASRETLARVVAPLEVPIGAEDPLSPAGKGRIVWWHENWMAAVDLTGFCAFSASSLLSDGIVSLDELADAIAPQALRFDTTFAHASARDRLLAAGATLVHLQRVFNERNDARTEDVPEELRTQLAGDGLWPEYARYRGLDERGALTAAARAAFGTPALLRLAAADEAPRNDATTEDLGERARSRGVVHVRALGPLAVRTDAAGTGDTLALEVALPDNLERVLRALAEHDPRLRTQLFNPYGEILPAVYRERRKLRADDTVHAGDRLELLVAIRGG